MYYLLCTNGERVDNPRCRVAKRVSSRSDRECNQHRGQEGATSKGSHQWYKREYSHSRGIPQNITTALIGCGSPIVGCSIAPATVAVLLPRTVHPWALCWMCPLHRGYNNENSTGVISTLPPLLRETLYIHIPTLATTRSVDTSAKKAGRATDDRAVWMLTT